MKARHALLTLSFLLAVPLVSAVNVAGVDFTGIAEAMGLAWGAIGALFSFEYVPTDEAIRLGIMKFFVFILILRVVQVALSKNDRGKGMFDNKTAAIIGFVVAGTTVMFTPNTWIFSSVIALLVPLGLIGFMCWYAMMKLKEDWVQHLFGLLLLFVTFFVNVFAIELFQETGQLEEVYVQPFALLLLNFTLVVILILIIVKLIQTLGGSEGVFRGWGRDGGRDRGPGDRGRGGDGGRGRGDGKGNEVGGEKVPFEGRVVDFDRLVAVLEAKGIDILVRGDSENAWRSIIRDGWPNMPKEVIQAVQEEEGIGIQDAKVITIGATGARIKEVSPAGGFIGEDVPGQYGFFASVDDALEQPVNIKTSEDGAILAIPHVWPCDEIGEKRNGFVQRHVVIQQGRKAFVVFLVKRGGETGSESREAEKLHKEVHKAYKRLKEECERNGSDHSLFWETRGEANLAYKLLGDVWSLKELDRRENRTLKWGSWMRTHGRDDILWGLTYLGVMAAKGLERFHRLAPTDPNIVKIKERLEELYSVRDKAAWIRRYESILHAVSSPGHDQEAHADVALAYIEKLVEAIDKYPNG